MTFENKLVAILNKDIEPGVVLNALGHMSIGMGADTPSSHSEWVFKWDQSVLEAYKDCEQDIIKLHQKVMTDLDF